MLPVQTTTSLCKVKFEWVSPSKQEHTHRYKLEVKSRTETYYEIECKASAKLECSVDMDLLQ